MGNGGGNPLASDQSRKELAVSLAASSMINASDMITPEAYQANPKHIQNAKEMAWMVEMNNKAAHKNFLVDQLEKRAKEGREAEYVIPLFSCVVKARIRWRIKKYVGAVKKPAGTVGAFLSDLSVPSYLDSPETVQFTNNAPGDNILPTTATLVEVPDSSASVGSLCYPHSSLAHVA